MWKKLRGLDSDELGLLALGPVIGVWLLWQGEIMWGSTAIIGITGYFWRQFPLSSGA